MPSCCNLQPFHLSPMAAGRREGKLFPAHSKGKSTVLFLFRITSPKLIVFHFRLRSMLKQLEEKDVDFEDIKKNLDFTASLLEAVYLDGTR